MLSEICLYMLQSPLLIHSFGLDFKQAAGVMSNGVRDLAYLIVERENKLT